MHVAFEASNKARFEAVYGQVLEDLRGKGATVETTEDSVAYGPVDYLIIGVVFVYQAALSGLTWDALKASIRPLVSAVLSSLRQQDRIAVYVEHEHGRTELQIPSTYPNVDIALPEGLRLKLKR